MGFYKELAIDLALMQAKAVGATSPKMDLAELDVVELKRSARLLHEQGWSPSQLRDLVTQATGSAE
ncbi:MAG: hypothetical protein HC927_04980 [Deltaproteobacteria bacterium]|nr:hypothetical protein [Deltaproteobacteria bacterium]